MLYSLVSSLPKLTLRFTTLEGVELSAVLALCMEGNRLSEDLRGKGEGKELARSPWPGMRNSRSGASWVSGNAEDPEEERSSKA